MSFVQRIVFFLLFFAISTSLFAQEEEEYAGDPKYREDQFYFGLSYNLLSDTPTGTKIQGVSGGLQFGYLRDMPINESRTVAIAIGGGLAFDRVGSNLFIGEDDNGESIFRVLDSNVQFDSNKFTTSVIEVPIEIRWRNSTPTRYKFWRVYGGVKFGYAFYYRALFQQAGNTVKQTKIPEFDRFRMTASLSFGRNSISLYANYSLNPFFKNAKTVEGVPVNFRLFKLGIIFYVL